MLEPMSLLIGLVVGIGAARLAGSLVVRWSRLTPAQTARLAPDQVIAGLRRALRRREREVAEREACLREFRDAYEQRARELDEMRRDVRDAVRLTRELRSELIERVHARVMAEHSPLPDSSA